MLVEPSYFSGLKRFYFSSGDILRLKIKDEDIWNGPLTRYFIYNLYLLIYIFIIYYYYTYVPEV